MTEPLRRLSAEGVAIWLDDLSRERLRTGNLAQLIAEKEVVGVTTNPTIFQTAISKSSAYDEQLKQLHLAGADAATAIREMTTDDVRDACDLFAPVFERTGGLDGRVSIEVDPRLGRDTKRTIAETHALWAEVDRPNLFIKIPATVEGLPAIRDGIANGININITLIFSIERYLGVMDAFAAGLEQRLQRGEPVAGITSVASFFVSRVDTEVDKRLETIGTDEALALRGKAAVANARLAFQAFEEFTATERWQQLESAGAARQRPLWASTGTKNPSYSDTLYVTNLVTAGVVNTMPEATLDAVADHGEITGDTVRPFYDDARQVMSALAGDGIDIVDVTRVLEDEGIEKFETAWNDLTSSVEATLEAAQ